MKKILLPVLCVAMLGACDKKSDDAVIVRQCGDYAVEIKFADDGQKMNAVINGDAVELVNVVAASGAKYDGVLNDTAVTLWGKGADWTMILDEDMVIECVAK